MNRNWIPEFSLVHPSARPAEWRITRDKWIAAASGEVSFEHVVCFDFEQFGAVKPKDAGESRLVWNYGKACSVDATNVAAQCAVGKVLVVISDDIYPCEHWDLRLKEIPELWGNDPCVVRVRTGGTGDDRGLLTVQILNRVRYEQVGYLFHPAYASMHSDDEFTLHAERDGVVVNAPDILMRHEHWTTGERPKDSVYERQNAPKRYQFGAALLKWRQENGFPAQVPPPFYEVRRAV
jgi:hypothetical protein